MRPALQDLAAEIIEMEEQFPLVEMGYEPAKVDLRIAELEQEVEVLRAGLGAERTGEDISARAREIVLRSMNRALVSAYETVAEATREVEDYRAEVLAEIAAQRAEAEAELARTREQLLRLRAQVEGSAPVADVEAEARQRAERIIARATAEADIIRGSAGHVATEQLSRVRADWQRRLETHRAELEAARRAYEAEREGYLALKRRVSERLGAASAAEVFSDLDEPRPPAVVTMADEAAFRRFFEDGVEDEPSRSWILGDE